MFMSGGLPTYSAFFGWQIIEQYDGDDQPHMVLRINL